MSTWHPILNAVELEPTVFELRAQYETPYAVVRLVASTDGTRAWRAVTWAEDPADRRLTGYYSTLLTAVKAAHLQWVSRSGLVPEAEYPTMTPWAPHTFQA